MVLTMPVKISKIVGNSASYPVYSRHSELAIDLWRNRCRGALIELNILNCFFQIFVIAYICPLSQTQPHITYCMVYVFYSFV